MYYSEKRAKEFLSAGGFNILHSVYFFSRGALKESVEDLDFPVVIKITGKSIVHKAKIGGVKLGVRNFREALSVFDKFKKINGFEGVVVQKQIKGREFFLGVKKTPEFGHVALFGSGGGNVERVKDVSFRVFPLTKKDVLEMISETDIFKKLKKEEVMLIAQTLMKFNSLVKKNPKVLELDINPLILNKGKAEVVDARIVFE